MNEGGYSPGERWVVRFADGGSAFVKRSEHRIEDEHLVYSTVSASCLPELIAYGDGLLVIEDLSAARWGTPLTEADCDALSAAFDALADVRAPEGLSENDLPPKWRDFLADPEPLLRIGLVQESWLPNVTALASAEAEVDLSGDRLVHRDLWLQNWCRADRGAVIVDWAGAVAANPMLMRAWGEAGIRAAGGPPGRVLSGEPGWAAFVAGLTVWFLEQDPPDTDPRLVETERRETWATLRWACDELDLPYPEPSEAFTSLGPWRP